MYKIGCIKDKGKAGNPQETTELSEEQPKPADTK
jgi:hypothetical protein